MIDATEQIPAVDRTVHNPTAASDQRVATISQTYATSVDDLWDACTNAERIPRWFLPVTGDLRLGGRFQLQGHAGGTIERCEPPRTFASTWEFDSEVSWIRIDLEAESDGRTRFTLTHTFDSDEKRWAEFGPGAVGVGWDMLLVGLVLHLKSGGAAVDPAAAMEWMGSAEGKSFVRMSSEQWRRANVAAGTDDVTAQQAADRTTAAYTGEPVAAE